jgi:hypothetical protein
MSANVPGIVTPDVSSGPPASAVTVPFPVPVPAGAVPVSVVPVLVEVTSVVPAPAPVAAPVSVVVEFVPLPVLALPLPVLSLPPDELSPAAGAAEAPADEDVAVDAAAATGVAGVVREIKGLVLRRCGGVLRRDTRTHLRLGRLCRLRRKTLLK